MIKRVAAFLSVLILAGIGALRTDAHKPITSRYTYNNDVFPILRDRCGRCHVAGGIAPMSLVTYRDAIPWAESIRVELTAGHMPPWFADAGYSDIRDSHRLSPRELDILLTWATGGTPEGPAKRLPELAIKNDWKLGKPDLVLPLAVFTLGSDRMEATQEFTVERASVDRWIRAADLLPGTPSIVRSATISARGVIAAWVPGDDPVRTPAGTAYRWAAGDDLTVRIHYVKTWMAEGKAVGDRSSVGLYFADPASREIRSVSAINSAVQVVAVRLQSGQPDKDLKVEAVRPDGSRSPLIRVLERPDWERRYWLARPLTFPAGTRIAVSGDRTAHVLLDITAIH